VAAPSANRFGHVSPTRPEHVMADLGEHPLLILLASSGGCCDVGIESTVLKLDEQACELVLLRRGGVPERELKGWIEQQGSAYTLRVKAPPRTGVGAASREMQLNSCTAALGAGADDQGALEAPGMLLTHYAPDAPSYLLSLADPQGCIPPSQGAPLMLEAACVLDFGGRASSLKGQAAAYRDLSPAANAAVAAQQLFEALRWTEVQQAAGARYVLLPDVLASGVTDDCLPALADRLFRAASGRSAFIAADGHVLPCEPY